MLGDLEQKIMQVMWNSNTELKPAQVQKALEGNWAYTTIMTVMKRLADKKLLQRQKQGNVYYYKAAKAKDQYVEKNLGKLYEQIVDSYGDLAISQFVDTLKTKPEDLKLLKEYLNQDL